MTNYFVHSGIISLIFFLVTFFKQKYITKKDKGMKLLLNDTIMVFISAVLGELAIQKIDNSILGKAEPTAFLGKPEF